VKATHLRRADLARQPGKVIADGGDLRVVQGSVHHLSISLYASEVVPGSGPVRHRHPYAEVFVLHEGRGRFEIDGTVVDAEAGDILIVPPETWHGFTNTGDGPLRETAIHENPRAVVEFEDGTRRD
jgi:mannose-6-phosphate isomerase-like protein (cupin superfamily)